jgi:hypothetical protein
MAVSRIPPTSSPQMTASGELVSGDTAVMYARQPGEDSVYTGRIAIPREATSLLPSVPISSPAAVQSAPIVPVVSGSDTLPNIYYQDRSSWPTTVTAAVAGAPAIDLFPRLSVLPPATTAAGSGDTSPNVPAPSAQTAVGTTTGAGTARGLSGGVIALLALAGLFLWQR